jgi:hypothetical protein
MFEDLFHRVIYYSALLTVIATVWVSAWSRSLVDEANRGYWPPLSAQPNLAMHNGAAAPMP